jgi:hypothetical protein
MRGSGMTTSSLTLKALVWREMAAVRERSSQNFLRVSASTAMKPSAPRRLHMRTTSEAARITAVSSSPTMSPISTIFGRPVALGLGRVADGAHVALVEVFEAGEQHAGGLAGAARLEVVGDLDDRRHRFAHLAEELEADGARAGGILCSTQRAATIRPSVPSFCTPGSRRGTCR